MKAMKKMITLGMVALTAGLAVGGELTVSPDGMSVTEALAKIRAARAAGDKETWTVRVSGRNRLAETLVFTPDDHDIAFVGETGAEFSGGVTLTGWADTGKGWFETAIPKGADGQPIYFEQLWVNGRRADRARYPNGTGFSRVKSPSVAEDPAATGSKRFVERVTFADGTEKILAQLPADEMPFAQLCVVHKWNFARRIIRGFDAKTGTLEVRGPAAWTWWQGWNEGETLVCLENVRAAFDAAGEWFYDQKNGKVLYRPLPGETLAALDAVAPVGGLSSIMRFDGDYRGGRFISNVSFKGILFGHSAATRPEVYKVDPKVSIDKYGWGPTETWQYQAAIQCDGAIYLCGVKGIRFDGCSFAHTGNYALRFASGCTMCEVTNCRLYDLGAGGIWMGSELDCRGDGCEVKRLILQPNRPDSTAHNLISNCVITAAGRFNPEATGVIIGHCSDTKVVHNDIYDILYTGISVGWVWGYAGSVAQRNEIAWNRIYDLGKGIMSDMGGVYTLGTSYGTRVHHNEIHDVRSFTYGGWALYCDEGSEGVTMDHNVCWNTTDGGFHQHYGVDNTIRNNVFAFNRDHAVVRISRVERDGTPSTLNFLDNIVYTTTGDLMAGWDGANDIGPIGGVFANNLWYRPDGGKISGKSWADWAASGRESGGAWGDPRFVDAAKFDFRLRDDSPAPKTGFKPFDLTGVGSTLR